LAAPNKGISLFSNTKMDDMSKQIDDRINKIFTEEDKKAQKIIDDNTNIGIKIINPIPVPSVTPITSSNTTP
jgi:hypothetical protein